MHSYMDSSLSNLFNTHIAEESHKQKAHYQVVLQNQEQFLQQQKKMARISLPRRAILCWYQFKFCELLHWWTKWEYVKQIIWLEIKMEAIISSMNKMFISIQFQFLVINQRRHQHLNNWKVLKRKEKWGKVHTIFIIYRPSFGRLPHGQIQKY